ncbi:hypothetical protein GQ457_12G011270 [Hibiscus cannabinus]
MTHPRNLQHDHSCFYSLRENEWSSMDGSVFTVPKVLECAICKDRDQVYITQQTNVGITPLIHSKESGHAVTPHIRRRTTTTVSPNHPSSITDGSFDSKMGFLCSVFDVKKQRKPIREVRTKYWKLREGENRLLGLLEGISIASFGKARRQGGSSITFVQVRFSAEFCISGLEYRYLISGIGTEFQHWNPGFPARDDQPRYPCDNDNKKVTVFPQSDIVYKQDNQLFGLRDKPITQQNALPKSKGPPRYMPGQDPLSLPRHPLCHPT